MAFGSSRLRHMPSRPSTAWYKKSPKGKAAIKRYRQSAKGRAAAARYRRSAKGKAVNARAKARHRAKLRASKLSEAG